MAKLNRYANLSVKNDGDSFKRAELGELFLEFSLGRVQAESEDAETSRRIRSVAVADVTTTTRHRRAAENEVRR